MSRSGSTVNTRFVTEGRQMDGHTQMDGWTDGQTDRQTDRQTDTTKSDSPLGREGA